ncbi:heterogeneous nuclear ribonucleoprotein H [Nephila pilipes]|uniref:Heterogeneous nuclear ribonucleoprotein H n=1 Tax=Nephila pilipes TaxID=299642 RepID=A0A8X6SZJ8_NEPPI|nr:heterogeneous nuclear ribonucleoprotein H [Nephila pilipes]
MPTKAWKKNNEHLGTRYIEVFRSKENEMEWALRRCGLDGQEAFGDACVRLRGLPFGCSKEEIAQFFTGTLKSLRAVYKKFVMQWEWVLFVWVDPWAQIV